jgi:hypothetical protein
VGESDRPHRPQGSRRLGFTAPGIAIRRESHHQTSSAWGTRIGNYSLIDKIGKDDLLTLVNWTLDQDVIEFDDYDEKTIKNQAHQIIYKSIFQKLRTLRGRRQEFIDESARLFLDAYESYREDSRS